MEKQIITTSDGSHSIYLPLLDEHYHSVHGAIQESRHVFIDAGLKQVPASSETVEVLEIGLGTGLNALLTLLEAEKEQLKTGYTAVEAFPVGIEMARMLNYIELLDAQAFRDAFDLIHTCEPGRETLIRPYFGLTRIQETIQHAILDSERYDLVYFDAFGPPTQPEMWTEAIFGKVYDSLKSGGILVTYCSKGEVQRTMKKVGFTLEKLKGPPGKREMLRGRKS